MITEKQLKKMAKIFRITKQTFQNVAKNAGIECIPNHVDELTKKEASNILTIYSGILLMEKEKNVNRNRRKR